MRPSSADTWPKASCGLGLCLLILLPVAVLGQTPAALDTLAANPDEMKTEDGRQLEREFRLVPAGNDPLALLYGFIDATTVRVFVDGELWQQNEDYRVRARSGVIIPLRAWTRSERSGQAADSSALVMIEYRFLPVPVTSRRDLRAMGSAPTGSSDETTPLFTAQQEAASWRTGNLQVSGSKTVQVSSGSRRELAVDQNLRLSIVGQLTRDISVRAFLSDDNLPVIPEGNTEELRDIDKVLVELTAPNWQATLGDFVARRSGTTFGNYRRKLQGVTVQATPGSTEFEVLAGSPRGLYRTLQIRGEESNQGPYYLGSGSGGQNLFIVAGSERVSVDGQLLTRGSDRDYVIDYVRGTVTFTYRRLITAESTIVVEYEEGEGPYGRTVLGAGAGVGFKVPFVGSEGRAAVRLIRERDDPSRLRTGDLEEEDEAVLRAAGDDPLLAVAPGATQTEPGLGMYDQQEEDGKTIYVYNAAGGSWNLTLFYVGPNLGDYALDRLTETGTAIYVHRGDELGSYLIGRPLDMPEAQSVVTMTASLGDTAATHLVAEWNLGDMDANRLSELDNDDNQGSAARVAAATRGQQLRLGSVPLGELDLSGFWEHRDAEFRPFQVHKTIFDYDQWGLADRARRPGFIEESDTELGVDAAWRTGTGGNNVEVKGHLGSLDHGADIAADQLSGTAGWNFWGGRGEHMVQTASAQAVVDPLDIERTKMRHRLSWVVGPITPRANYNFRRWQDTAITGTRSGGFRLEELGVGIGAAPGRNLDWRVDFQRGLADSVYGGQWDLQRDGRTLKGGVTTGRFAGMRLVGEGTLRRILKPGLPDQTTRLARLNLAGNWIRSASDWSVGYRVDNSRTEVLDRQIIFVGDGLGDYNEDGDYVGPGQGDHDMVLAGTDSLVATTAVVADVNWRQGFSFLGAERWYGAWSALTLVSVDSRSTTDDVSALLRFDPKALFDNQHTVLTDLNFSEELTFLQHLRKYDLRGKFDFRQAKDRQFSDHPEDRIQRGWQVNGNATLSQVSSLKLRWYRLDERRQSTESSSSARRSYESLTRRYEVGWNLRPRTDVRLGIQGEYVTRQDAVSEVSQREYALRPQWRHRFHRQWTLQAELRLAQVISDEPAGALRPWFYAYPGRNVDSSVRLAWDPTEFLAVAVNWVTRKQGDRRWQHDLRLESTARF